MTFALPRQGSFLLQRTVWIFLATLSLFPHTLAFAAGVTVNADSSGTNISLVIDNATVELALENLSDKYGFRIIGLENTPNAAPFSATMTGSLQSVLSRLLRNRNYLIVRSSDNANRIVEIKILDSAYGAAPRNASSMMQQQPPAKKTGF